MIVPYPAGGPTDTLARILRRAHEDLARPADHHRERQPAPAGSIGGRAGARAPRPTATRSASATGARTSCSAPRSIAQLRRADATSSRSRCWPSNPICDRGAQGPAAEEPDRIDRLAEGADRQGHRSARSASAAPRDVTGVVLPAGHRHAIPVRAVPRRRRRSMQDLVAGHIDHRCSAWLRRAVRKCAAGTIKAYAFITAWATALLGRPGNSHGRRGRAAGLLHLRCGTRWWAPTDTPRI